VEPRPDQTQHELLEWLGLKPADFLVYGSLAAVGGMFFLREPLWDVVLACLAVVLSIIACPLGMKRDPNLSEFTNKVKLFSYVPFVLMVVGAIVVHYVYFNR
jgi:NO-binding membrane sensor protein with MHYT domain